MNVEEASILAAFTQMLEQVTHDGAIKRMRGEKPPWWRAGNHEAAFFSHLSRWKHHENVDPDSKAHPLIHAAFRLLAIAWQETHGKVPPEEVGCRYPQNDRP